MTPRPSRLAWTLLSVALVFSPVLRVAQLHFPLERDEGEYAYIGQLMLQGVPPYTLAYTMKLPGAPAAYALVMALLGQSAIAIRVGMLLISVAAALLLYLIARRMTGVYAAAAAAASLLVLSVSPSVLGMSAHATQLVVLFALLGTWLLERSRSNFGAGLAFGLAVLMKQAGALFLLSAMFRRRRPRSAALLLAGVVVPFGLTCAILAAAGTFSRFWFWTVTYAREYGTALPLRDGVVLLGETGGAILAAARGLWLLAGIGAVAALVHRETRSRAAPALLLLAAGSLATCPGLHFRQHYFVLVLPGAALCVGLGIEAIARLLARRRGMLIAWAIFAAAFADASARAGEVYLGSSSDRASRAIYGPSPFPESPRIAAWIREHSQPEDRIAVIGSEPQIYFYSGRRSATGYIYTYGLMEQQPYALAMQRDMIEEIERARPRYLVIVNVAFSWLPQPGSPTAIFDWIKRVEQDPNWDRVGVVDIVATDQTDYVWGVQAHDREPRSNYFLFVYERRNSL